MMMDTACPRRHSSCPQLIRRASLAPRRWSMCPDSTRISYCVQDGEQYLRQVMLEAQRYPDSLVANHIQPAQFEPMQVIRPSASSLQPMC